MNDKEKELIEFFSIKREKQPLEKILENIEIMKNIIENQQAEIEKKDKTIKMLIDEREYIKNNLEVDLNRKGVFSQAKGQISQILEYYKNNDKYFEKKAEEDK